MNRLRFSLLSLSAILTLLWWLNGTHKPSLRQGQSTKAGTVDHCDDAGKTVVALPNELVPAAERGILGADGVWRESDVRQPSDWWVRLPRRKVGWLFRVVKMKDVEILTHPENYVRCIDLNPRDIEPPRAAYDDLVSLAASWENELRGLDEASQ